MIMKNTLFKSISLFTVILLVAACGSEPEAQQETTFYKKENITNKKLELSIEASGVIEAISSIEIKSKASGEVLFLGAEVGDLVDKGAILGQIDQRTPNNILNQAKSDLEASKVRLENAQSQFNRGKELHANASISDKDFEDIEENFVQAKSALVRNEVSFENAINMRSPVISKINKWEFTNFTSDCPMAAKFIGSGIENEKNVETNNHPISLIRKSYDI